MGISKAIIELIENEEMRKKLALNGYTKLKIILVGKRLLKNILTLYWDNKGNGIR